MPQFLPFYFINQISFCFFSIIIIIYIFSKWILPNFPLTSLARLVALFPNKKLNSPFPLTSKLGSFSLFITSRKSYSTLFFYHKFVRSYSTNSLNPIIPIKIYYNADTMKLQILKDQRGKSDIDTYHRRVLLNFPIGMCFDRWIQRNTGKCYVGSAADLSIRFSRYYQLSQLIKNNMIINKALLKYGYNSTNFFSCLEKNTT
jgi:F-type H+-transporting ATPase subunit 8